MFGSISTSCSQETFYNSYYLTQFFNVVFDIDIKYILQKCANNACTINSKINGTLKGVNMPISKLHSILAVPN